MIRSPRFEVRLHNVWELVRELATCEHEETGELPGMLWCVLCGSWKSKRSGLWRVSRLALKAKDLDREPIVRTVAMKHDGIPAGYVVWKQRTTLQRVESWNWRTATGSAIGEWYDSEREATEAAVRHFELTERP